MSTTTYDASLTMQDAVKQYFEVNHFGSDGGYNDKFVELKVGPMVMFLPNVPSRVRAVRVHDLHHVLTGYQTNWIGEFEISAWELATNCSNYGAALVLNLSGLISGLGLARAKISGRAAILATMSFLSTPPADRPRKTSASAITSPSVRAVVFCANWILSSSISSVRPS